jgi:hypothetical protein
MTIYIIYNIITKYVESEAYVNEQLANHYAKKNDMLAVKPIHLDVTVDIKKGFLEGE